MAGIEDKIMKRLQIAKNMVFLSDVRINDIAYYLKGIQEKALMTVNKNPDAPGLQEYHKDKYEQTSKLIKALRTWQNNFQD
jgi:hypothetical protein